MRSRQPDQGPIGEAFAEGGAGRAPAGSHAMRIARVVLLVAPWAFILYIFRDVNAALDPFTDASLAPLLLGSLLSLLAVCGFAVLWIRLLGRLSRQVESVDVSHLLRVYARSWLARYLPGKLWSLGARIVHTDVHVMPRMVVARGLLYELAAILSSAIVLGLGLWTWAVIGPLVGVPVLLGGAAAVVVIMWRLDVVTRITVGLIQKLVPKQWTVASDVLREAAERPGLGARASVLFAGGYLLNNFLLALGFVLIASSLAEVGWGDVSLLAGAYSLAVVLGMVAFFAPAGLGVREGILVGFSASVLSAPVAATTVVLARIINVLADAVFVGLVEGGSLLRRRTTRGWRPRPHAAEGHGWPSSDRRGG
jgi:hypothetical protein